MVWGKAKPTTPGWYWFRHTPRSGPQCVEVVRPGTREPDDLAVFLVGVKGTSQLVRLDGEWAGPITPPTEYGRCDACGSLNGPGGACTRPGGCNSD